jgi:hypothetical protein
MDYLDNTLCKWEIIKVNGLPNVYNLKCKGRYLTDNATFISLYGTSNLTYWVIQPSGVKGLYRIISYNNYNTNEEIYKSSKRNLQTLGNNNNPSISYSQTIKGKKAGNVLQLFLSGNKSWQSNNRYFTQKYYLAH